ncbi:hypothetical protein, partial [Promicromonospora kroppenstedtii]|uniref:hypothetical protein n=1 Tax=Promicromonospora kroppenstedtii TaxID=440482 RepID=UPI001B7FE3B2
VERQVVGNPGCRLPDVLPTTPNYRPANGDRIVLTADGVHAVLESGRLTRPGAPDNYALVVDLDA